MGFDDNGSSLHRHASSCPRNTPPRNAVRTPVFADIGACPCPHPQAERARRGQQVKAGTSLATTPGKRSTLDRFPALSPPSFRRLEQRRPAGADLLQQRRLLGLGCREVTQLDMAEAADFFRDGCQADREIMVVGREFRQQLIQ